MSTKWVTHMSTEDQKNRLVQIRVSEADKNLLDSIATEQDQSLPKVIHKILEERTKLRKNNLAYLEAEAQRTDRTVWQVLDNIVFDHQGREMFKRRNAHFRSLEDKVSQEDIEEIAAYHKCIAEQWTDL
jgi:hypothetical protein